MDECWHRCCMTHNVRVQWLWLDGLWMMTLSIVQNAVICICFFSRAACPAGVRNLIPVVKLFRFPRRFRRRTLKRGWPQGCLKRPSPILGGFLGRESGTFGERISSRIYLVGLIRRPIGQRIHDPIRRLGQWTNDPTRCHGFDEAIWSTYGSRSMIWRGA